MVTLLFLTLAVLAVVHVVFEAIIAPTLRLKVKYAFFALRDKVYALKAAYPEQLSDEVFDDLIDSINGSMAIMDRVTLLWLLQNAGEVSRELKDEVERRETRLHASPVPGIREIIEEHERLFYTRVLINSAGMLISMVPLVFVVAFGTKITDQIRLLALGGDRRADHTHQIAMS